MFLDVLMRRNPRFVEAAMSLHQAGQIPANSYVLDLDAVKANARLIRQMANSSGMTVLAMTKQVGRNPAFLDALNAAGIAACVAVDMAGARAVTRHGMAVGHIGHLVQVPRAERDAAAAMLPMWWTVFSHEKANEAAKASVRAGRTQDLLARIHAEGDKFYPGHEGGFAAADLVEVARQLDALDGGRFAGITTFPALLYDQDHDRVVPTPNLLTLQRGAQTLRAAGFEHVEINAPGTTSTNVLPVLAEAGVTQVEPGHGLTGTTPLHAFEELPEQPAALYITEVSHLHAGLGYCFGGGMYIDPVFPDYQVRALVGGEPTVSRQHLVDIEIPSPAAIDYYGMIDPGSRRLESGNTVVMGFRMQAFVTRAFVVPVRGVLTDHPEVVGIFDTDGRPMSWPC